MARRRTNAGSTRNHYHAPGGDSRRDRSRDRSGTAIVLAHRHYAAFNHAAERHAGPLESLGRRLHLAVPFQLRTILVLICTSDLELRPARCPACLGASSVDRSLLIKM